MLQFAELYHAARMLGAAPPSVTATLRDTEEDDGSLEPRDD